MRIPSTELAKKIREVKSFIPNKATIPVLQDMLIKGEYLMACNTELGVMVKLEAISGISEPFLLPPKAYELLMNMTEGNTEIIPGENFRLDIRNGKSKSSFSSDNPAEYSFDMDLDNEGRHEAVIDADVFRKAVSSCLFAVNEKEEKNRMMQGISITTSNGYLDIFGMCHAQIAWNRVEYEGELDLMIPVSSARKLCSLDLHGEMMIFSDRNTAVFKTKNYTVWTRLLDVDRIELKRVFKEPQISTSVDRLDMLKVLGRIAALSQGGTSLEPVKLRFNDDGCEITFMSQLASYTETVMLGIPVDTGVEISFNPKLLYEMFKAYQSDEINLYFDDRAAPLLVSADDSLLKVVLLPVKTRSIAA